MPLILASNSASGGYNVANSLRFNSGSFDSLTKTPASAGNRKTFTFSCWFKLSNIASSVPDYYQIFGGYTGAGNDGIWISDSDKLYVFLDSAERRITNQVIRDVSAWYHLIFAVDTTQATASNRIKLYLNGSEITSFSTNTNPSLNYDSGINNNTLQNIGTRISDDYFNGYIAETYFIDGQQLTPSSFGETDTLTGIWKPKAYTGSFGTNGFYLQFKNSAALGTDSSGNGNTYTVNNLTSIDQSTDTPTNNFATLNFLVPNSDITYSQGNLAEINNVDASYRTFRSTIAVSSGKWYAEFKAVSGFDNIDMAVGVVNIDTAYSPTSNISAFVGGFSYGANGGVREYNSSTVDTEATYTTGDIIGVALDLTNNKLYFSKNGTFINSADPAAGTNGYSITSGKTYCFTGSTILYAGLANLWNANFGSPPFTISSGNADANGYGNFEYAVPSGFYALNTKNLADYG